MSAIADVTAVVTTYQSGPDIAEALLSIRDQTVLPQEILVVDDGSTDDTGQQAGRHHVRLIELAHTGSVARSRNVGWQSAATKYVAFLDADDRWLPSHLERSIPLMERTTAAVACGNAIRCRAQLEEPFFRHLDESSPFSGQSGDPFEVSLPDLIRVRPVVMSSVVVRRDAFARIGGFDERDDIVASEDFDAWLNLALTGECIVFDPAAHVRYVETAQSLTRGDREDRGRCATLRVLQSARLRASDHATARMIQREILRDRVLLARSRARRRELRAAVAAFFRSPAHPGI